MTRSRFGIAIASAAILVTALVGPVPASANTSGSITYDVNSSDPELIQCPNAAGTGMTMCLFTSQDMGDRPVPYGPELNYYPMYQTMLFRLNDNTDASDPNNWVNMGGVVSEGMLDSRGLVPSGANHLWAPGVRYWNGKYYLYVPDVRNRTDESHSSRLFLFTSTTANGTGPYSFVGLVSTPGWPNNGYASDPAPFLQYGTTPWMVYANGDNSNCGGLSMGQLNSSTMTTFTNPAAPVQINGWSSAGLGTCGSTGHPYLEGPALYHWNQVGAPASLPFFYVMIFAAKPNNGVPPACAGAPEQSDYEVIAYATANQIQGPYDYQGIIMCGSSTEWTNQASILQHTANNGKYLLAWHDGGDTAHNRRTHLSCVRWGSDGKIVQIPRSSWNLSNCT